MLGKKGIWLGIFLLLWNLAQPVWANQAEKEKKPETPAANRMLKHSIVLDIQGDVKQIGNLSAVRALAGEGIKVRIPDEERLKPLKPADALQSYLYLADSIHIEQEIAGAYDKIVQDNGIEILSRARATWATEKPQHLQVKLELDPQQLVRLNKQLLSLYGAVYQAGLWHDTLVIINIIDKDELVSIWKGPGLIIKNNTLLMPASIYNRCLQEWVDKRKSEPPLPSLTRQPAGESQLWQKELELWQQALVNLSETVQEKEKTIQSNEETIKNITAMQADWQRRERELKQRLQKNADLVIWWRAISGIIILVSLIFLYLEYKLLRKRYLLF